MLTSTDAGLQDVTTGDTLCDERKPIVLERMEFPDPVIKVRIGQKSCQLSKLSDPFMEVMKRWAQPVSYEVTIVYPHRP